MGQKTLRKDVEFVSIFHALVEKQYSRSRLVFFKVKSWGVGEQGTKNKEGIDDFRCCKGI